MPKNPYNLTPQTLKGRLPDVTGDVIFVDSNDGNSGADGSSLRPFDSIESAFNKSGLSYGDTIVAMPGHAETVSAAGGITADVAGVRVIGLGEGAKRPTITFSDTAATIAVSSASITFEGIIVVPSVDSVVSPFVVSAADVTIGTPDRPVEVRDASASVEFVRGILTTAAADNFKSHLVYKGFTAGNACVNAIRLVGVDNAEIYVDFYGVASTAVVEFETTACTNVHVTGRFYVSGTTDFSKNVVDTVTGSTWSVDAFDATADEQFAGGDAAPVAQVDVSAVATAVGTNVNSTTTDSINGKIGTDTEMADSSLFDMLAGSAGVATFPAAAAPGNGVSIAEVVRDTWDVLRNGTGGSEPATNKSIMDYVGVDQTFYVPGLGYRVQKTSNLADGSGTDALFDITGTVMCTLLVGEVTTVLATSTTMKLTDTTNTVDLCAATTITSDADGTMYLFSGVASETLNSGVTPVVGVAYKTTGGLTQVILGNDGGSSTISHILDGAGTGNVLWTMYYMPLTTGATVAAAA